MPTRTAPSLDVVLSELLGADVDSVHITRSDYSTSYPIDDVTVRLADGAYVDLVRKDLSWAALLPAARRAKPVFLYEPQREMRVYTEVLPGAPSGPARCFGIDDRPTAGRRWLFLERLQGVELYQVGDLSHWEAAARWAGRLHGHFEGRTAALQAAGVPLLVHDWDWLRRWADRAVAGAGRDRNRAVRHLRGRAGSLWARLASQPTTLIHGEFYASNVIVHGRRGEPRVSPVDWEMAAVAPGLVDLAALTGGQWTALERRGLEVAYAASVRRRPDDDFGNDLDACRLALCIQWLGWRRRWRAPPEHSVDWLAEALVLVDRLEL